MKIPMISFVFLAVVPGVSVAACERDNAEAFYREYLAEALKISSVDDDRTYKYLSGRVVNILKRDMRYFTDEGFSEEEIKQKPFLKNKLEMRRRLGEFAMRGDRVQIPSEVKPTVEGGSESMRLLFAWPESSEDRDPRTNEPFPVVRERNVAVSLVCEDSWKVDGEITDRYDHKVNEKRRDRPSVHIKFPNE